MLQSIQSLKDAEEKLGGIAFFGSGYYAEVPVIGVHCDHEGWTWGGKGYKFFSEKKDRIKPWLRNLLGLPLLPESIQIYEP